MNKPPYNILVFQLVAGIRHPPRHSGRGSVATGMGAKAAIWIVSDPRPEHIAAVAWLNESGSAAFYMVKVEAVRIGTSPAAPLLTLRLAGRVWHAKPKAKIFLPPCQYLSYPLC